MQQSEEEITTKTLLEKLGPSGVKRLRDNEKMAREILSDPKNIFKTGYTLVGTGEDGTKCYLGFSEGKVNLRGAGKAIFYLKKNGVPQLMELKKTLEKKTNGFFKFAIIGLVKARTSWALDTLEAVKAVFGED